MAERSPGSLSAPLRYALQALAYAAFATFVGYFSSGPPYRLRGDDEAVVKLSFTHSAQLAHACRERSAEELARLAPNMRTKLDCPRGRECPVETPRKRFVRSAQGAYDPVHAGVTRE